MSTETSNITFVLYEGKHDAAILTRILRENNYSNFSDKKISEFPPVLKGFLEGKIKNYTYEDESNIFQKPQLPNAICKSKTEDKWFVFYEMGGDSKIVETNHFIKTIARNTSEFEEEELFETQQLYSLAFFFDADADVNRRKTTFIESYSDNLPQFCTAVSQSAENHLRIDENIDGFSSVGLFVYGADNGTGTLEDIVIPIMREGKEAIFTDADTYLEKHMSTEAKANGSKKGKALISVVGQPKHQGKANQVIISDTKMITKAKLAASPVFANILSFMTGF